MKTVRQLLRQPLKTAAGILLTALAVAVLCLCAGQSFAAALIHESLSQTLVTLVLPAEGYDRGADAWLLTYARENPNIVKTVNSPALTSAYIPELVADNFTQHEFGQPVPEDITAEPYDAAMLEIRLTDISEPKPMVLEVLENVMGVDGKFYEVESRGEEFVLELTGTVLRTIGLQEGYADPAGFTARIELTVANQTALEELKLAVGERYLVYTNSYRDLDYELRHELSKEYKMPLLDAFGSQDCLIEPEESDYWGRMKLRFQNNMTWVTREQSQKFRSVLLKVQNTASIPRYEKVTYEDGKEDWVLMGDYGYTDGDGVWIPLTKETYMARYEQPSMALLTGSAEDFLRSEEGALWQEALENIQINTHAFPVIGVENMNYLPPFSQGSAWIAEGRDFLEEELAQGAAVCIISESLAQANDLAIGDHILPRLYSADVSLPCYADPAQGDYAINPGAADYFSRTMQLPGDAQPFTVVGIYKRWAAWTTNGEDCYSFTPNTIFIPKAAAAGTPAYSYKGLFRSAILESEYSAEFLDAARRAGIGEQIIWDDQGYASAERALEGYRQSADRALLIGSAVYGAIMLLFLLLFPLRQGGAVAIMQALGAGRGSCAKHVFVSGMAIVLCGTVLGVLCGYGLWGTVTGRIAEGSAFAAQARAASPDLLSIAAAQLGLVAVLVGLIAVCLACRKTMGKRIP